MKRTLTAQDIANDICADDNANWSWSGALALGEWLVEMDEECGTDTEFCRVGIRCDFSEYSCLHEWASDYFGRSDYAESEGWEIERDEDGQHDPESRDEAIRNHINDNGHLVEFDGGAIVSSF